MKANYPECERRVLLSEGGYTNDPRDPGGPTNWGITLADARLHWKPDATADDVRAMPRNVAERIYKDKYWDALACDTLPAGLDYTVFDYGVNSGIRRAARVLLEANSSKGSDTVAVIDYINDERLAFLKSLTHNGQSMWATYGRGWGSRVASVKAFSEHLALQPPSTVPAPHYTMEPSAKAYYHKLEVPPPKKPAPPSLEKKFLNFLKKAS